MTRPKEVLRTLSIFTHQHAKQLHQKRQVLRQLAAGLNNPVEIRGRQYVHFPGYVPGTPYIEYGAAMALYRKLASEVANMESKQYYLEQSFNQIMAEIDIVSRTLPHPEAARELESRINRILNRLRALTGYAIT